MELLLRVSFCLLMFIGETFGDNIVTKEGKDVILNCSHPGKDDLTRKVFEWKKDSQEVFFYEDGKHYNNNGKDGQDKNFKNRVEFFEDKLQFGDASIRIKNTKLTDSGNYSCGFPDPKVVHHKLIVDAVAKPIAKRIGLNKGWALLRCEVFKASPKPSVAWYNSAEENISNTEPEVRETGDYYTVTLTINVTKSDNYTCGAKQETLHHQLSVTLSIGIEGDDEGLSPGYVILIVAVAVILSAIVTTTVLYFLWKHKRSSGDRTKDVANSEGELHHLEVQKDSELTNEA